jgi:hypothetical protein
MFETDEGRICIHFTIRRADLMPIDFDGVDSTAKPTGQYTLLYLIEACASFRALSADKISNVCEIHTFFSPQRHRDTEVTQRFLRVIVIKEL